MRDRGKVIEARELFRVCARTSCPAVVRKDCSKWLAEIEESVPTIVIAARGPSGADIIDLKVSVDGEVVATRADGKPIAINPGEHTLRFEAEGVPPKTEPVVIRTGEKNRMLRVELGAGTSETKPKPVVAEPPQGEPVVAPSSGPPAGFWILGGLGVVALGSFAYFGVTSKSDLDDLRATCAPYCPQSELDSVKSRMLVADISLGVGIASLAVATVLLVTSGSKNAAGTSAKTTGARAPRVDLRPGAARGGIVIAF
jgi:hypothetical protein